MDKEFEELRWAFRTLYTLLRKKQEPVGDYYKQKIDRAIGYLEFVVKRLESHSPLTTGESNEVMEALGGKPRFIMGDERRDYGQQIEIYISELSSLKRDPLGFMGDRYQSLLKFCKNLTDLYSGDQRKLFL